MTNEPDARGSILRTAGEEAMNKPFRKIETALIAAQSCIEGETPETCSVEMATEMTLSLIKQALLVHLKAARQEAEARERLAAETMKADCMQVCRDQAGKRVFGWSRDYDEGGTNGCKACGNAIEALPLPAVPAAPPDAREKRVAQLETALRKYAIRQSFDWPGDSAEACGLWCDICQEHVTEDGDGHAETCLLHSAALAGSACGDAAEGTE